MEGDIKILFRINVEGISMLPIVGKTYIDGRLFSEAIKDKESKKTICDLVARDIAISLECLNWEDGIIK